LAVSITALSIFDALIFGLPTFILALFLLLFVGSAWTASRPPSRIEVMAAQHAQGARPASPKFVYWYVSVKMVPVGSREPGTAIGVEPLTISIPT
jgi:hypothetical protein